MKEEIMAKAINVKVSRLKVIDKLRNKLVEMQKMKDIYEEAEKNWEMNHSVWKDQVAQIAYTNFDITKASKKSVVVRNWHGDKTTRVEVEVELDSDKLPNEPQRPKNPFESYGYGRQYVGGYDDRVADIINAINILEMSDEEVVSTSTYASVARFL
jgi:hypothetical protein